MANAIPQSQDRSAAPVLYDTLMLLRAQRLLAADPLALTPMPKVRLSKCYSIIFT